MPRESSKTEVGPQALVNDGQFVPGVGETEGSRTLRKPSAEGRETPDQRSQMSSAELINGRRDRWLNKRMRRLQDAEPIYGGGPLSMLTMHRVDGTVSRREGKKSVLDGTDPNILSGNTSALDSMHVGDDNRSRDLCNDSADQESEPMSLESRVTQSDDEKLDAVRGIHSLPTVSTTPTTQSATGSENSMEA